MFIFQYPGSGQNFQTCVLPQSRLAAALCSKLVPAEARAELNFALIPDIERFHLPTENIKEAINIPIKNLQKSLKE